MKILVTFLILLLFNSCAQHRSPSSITPLNLAQDTMAFGNIKASAIKILEKDDVCFDISIQMKGVDQQDAIPSNWTVAWVDKQSQYHLLSLNQRDPASVPQGGQKIAPYGAYQEWTNTFRACASKARLDDVKSLILTPKTLPYKATEGLNLEW